PDAADVATYFLTSSYLFPILAYAVARMVHRVSVRLEHARAIGSYELIERIGESAQARDALVQRFEREARATAALRSIHTIDVYDFGVTDEGDFYYVM